MIPMICVSVAEVRGNVEDIVIVLRKPLVLIMRLELEEINPG